jgi:flavodoxin
MKTLVAYFSASGVTAKVARELAEAMGADLFEIRPETPYSAADLRWTNPMARCNREKFGKKDVPVAGRVEDFGQYDAVLIGFPIWYYCAPNVVNTFCKGYDWTGKRVYAFATSGGSGIGKTAEKLAPFVRGAVLAEARLVRGAADLQDWIKALAGDVGRPDLE